MSNTPQLTRDEHPSRSSGRPPLVSIVVNNYNYAAYLTAAVDSALNQTYSPVEVIVVDDGSTDASRQILLGYSDRANVILQDNRGQCQAANTGFAASHGEIVFFLDADDMLMPNAAEQVVKLWNPSVAKVHFKLEAVNHDGESLSIAVPRSPLQDGDLSRTLMERGEYCTPPTSGNAYSRAALLEVLPVPSDWPSKKALDKYLLHSVPFFGLVSSAAMPLGYYRIHGNNRSQLTGCDQKSISIMRAYLLEQLSVRDLIARTARRKGLEAAKSSVVNGYTFRKNRLVLKRLGVVIPGLPDESRLAMMFHFITAVWKGSDLDKASQCFLTAWAFGVAFLPLRLAQKIVLVGMSPASRPAWLKKLVLGFSTRSRALKTPVATT